ncbi:MAG: HlyD family secretion protein, partial [Sphingopyxis sp.]
MTDIVVDNSAAAPSPTDQDNGPVDSAENSAKRRMWMTRLGMAVGVAALLWGAWWFFAMRGLVSTDNAYVSADTAQVTPLVPGAVADVRVIDTQDVARGDVLVVLDDADARVELSMAQAALEQARQRYRQVRATGSSLAAQVGAATAAVRQAQAARDSAQVELRSTREAYERRAGLLASGAVSAEELATAR